jgi:hypothetical protein
MRRWTDYPNILTVFVLTAACREDRLSTYFNSVCTNPVACGGGLIIRVFNCICTNPVA